MDPGVEYRKITRCEGYLVGDDGSIWSCRTNAGKCDETKWKRLKTPPDSDGYPIVTLPKSGHSNPISLKGKQFTKKVSVIVLEEFVGQRPVGLVACHNNGKNWDNRLSNLRWDTIAANNLDTIKHGATNTPFGQKHWNATLSEKSAFEILHLWKTGCFTSGQLGAAYKVGAASVRALVSRQSWQHLKCDGLVRRNKEKFNDDDVRDIRRLLKLMPISKVAWWYATTYLTIWYIKQRKTYKGIEPSIL